VLDEERDVLAPLAQRRHVEGHHVEPVVEVLPELARAHGRPEVHVGRRQHADVDGDRPHAPEPLDLALLERAQELRLEVEPQRADLVEEEGAALGELELAELPRVGAREGALLVAEQLGLDERVGDRRHVDRDERLRPPLAPRVERARDQLLAGPALARDEHRRRGVGDLGDGLVDLHHLPMAADQTLEPRAGRRVRGLARQRRAQVEDFTLEGALLERALREQQDLVHVERLGEVVPGAPLEGLDRGAHLAHRGDDDDDRRRVGGLHAREHVDARLARHALVEHHEVHVVGAEDLERRRPVLGLEDVAGLLEDRPHRRAHAVLVVHDEHGPAAHPLGRVGDHGRGARSMTRYSLVPLAPGRWT
jgi:hypothetical protein